MKSLFTKLFSTLDDVAENQARQMARLHGRRSFISKAGMAMAGAVMLPLLPFDRSTSLAFAGEADGDLHSCDYWRYCAMDGNLCSESGGSVTSCPPGSEASKVAWVGTCRNPNDGKDYLISYNDCCGKVSVDSAAYCFNSHEERPGYRMGLSNDINWCVANPNKGYHCTVAMVMGAADA